MKIGKLAALCVLLFNSTIHAGSHDLSTNQWVITAQEMYLHGKIIGEGEFKGLGVTVEAHRVDHSTADTGTYHSIATATDLHARLYHIASSEFFAEVSKFSGVWHVRTRSVINYTAGHGDPVDTGWTPFTPWQGCLPYGLQTDDIVLREVTGGFMYFGYGGDLNTWEYDPELGLEILKTVSATVRKSEYTKPTACSYYPYVQKGGENGDHALGNGTTTSATVAEIPVPAPGDSDLGAHVITRIRVFTPGGVFQ